MSIGCPRRTWSFCLSGGGGCPRPRSRGPRTQPVGWSTPICTPSRPWRSPHGRRSRGAPQPPPSGWGGGPSLAGTGGRVPIAAGAGGGRCRILEGRYQLAATLGFLPVCRVAALALPASLLELLGVAAAHGQCSWGAAVNESQGELDAAVVSGGGSSTAEVGWVHKRPRLGDNGRGRRGACASLRRPRGGGRW